MRWLLLLLLLAGCAKADDGRETVRFWAMGREGEVVAELIPEFERLNPGIKVELQQRRRRATHQSAETKHEAQAPPGHAATHPKQQATDRSALP